MSLEVRQLVLRADVRSDDDDDDEGGARGNASCGGGDDPCEDKESLKEEILAAVRLLVREELRALRER